jgi:hypothetical protein
MSQLFYSQVNTAVQQELIARGSVRTQTNSTDALDFMLGKIANVQLEAYESQPTTDSKPIEGFGTLGGFTVTSGSYRSLGPNGFLNDQIRPSYRIPPVITDLSVSVNDQSKMYINKANITIKILDATTDLEAIEQIYCAPGRYIRLQIVHPDEAVLSGKTLADSTNTKFPSTDLLQQLFPGVSLKNLKKLNEYYFSGRISTFSFSYAEDGTIDLSVEAIGTTNTYLDVNATLADVTGSTATGVTPATQVENLYTLLLDEVKQQEVEFKKQNKSDFEYLTPGTTDQSIIVGIPYKYANASAPSSIRMISVGYFIDFINRKFMEKVGAKIVCTDAICKSNKFYTKLVSADPTNILLWSGTSNAKTDSYYFDASDDASQNSSIAQSEQVTPVDPVMKMFPNIKPAVTQGFLAADGNAYPARIYINIEIIRQITTEIEKEPTIKKLLNTLSEKIQKNTGNAINMVLVQDPLIEDALLYTDANFVDSSASVQEFSLPAWPGLTGRSVVRNFSLSTNVPNSVKNMIFGITSAETGTQKQVAFSSYIYANAETKKKLEETWKTSYKTNIVSLAKAKNDVAYKLTDGPAAKTLQEALAKYVTYFTDDIKQSLNFTKAFFPMNLEFTIDGINGLKYGDILQFDGIPKRYKDAFVFMIVGITHTVSTSGDWTTQVTCNPRVRSQS